MEMIKSDRSHPSVSKQSLIGLNAVNFFLAEVVGVILPFLAAYLKQKQWSYEQIGFASAAAGLGTLIFQAPSGFICDRIKNRRLLLASMSLVLGLAYGILPFFSHQFIWVNILLFISGAAGAFFVPLLATLALSLVGEKKLDQTLGVNQSFNHAGNITAALTALLVVEFLGIEAIFFIMASVSLLAIAAVFLIKGRELENDSVHSRENISIWEEVSAFFKSKKIRTLLICVALFHIANAPIMPLVALYLKHLGEADSQIAWVVLIAQVVMVPVALLAGKYCGNLGRKPVFAVAFLVLPVRILLYSFTTQPNLLLSIQVLDGIGAGIYGVVIALMCSDLTRENGGFNALMGLAQTALALGGVAGPLVQGYLTEHLGFPRTFLIFASVAIVGAFWFILKMPETKNVGGEKADE